MAGLEPATNVLRGLFIILAHNLWQPRTALPTELHGKPLIGYLHGGISDYRQNLSLLCPGKPSVSSPRYVGPRCSLFAFTATNCHLSRFRLLFQHVNDLVSLLVGDTGFEPVMRPNSPMSYAFYPITIDSMHSTTLPISLLKTKRPSREAWGNNSFNSMNFFHLTMIIN